MSGRAENYTSHWSRGKRLAPGRAFGSRAGAKELTTDGVGNLEVAMAPVHEDYVMEWPQSGERFRGRDNALGT